LYASDAAIMPSLVAASEAYNASGAVPYYVRPVAEIAGFFDGLELVEPGVVRVPEWRPEGSGDAGSGSGDAGAGSGEAAVDAYCGVGRKP
jgi:hypothetical protein